MAMKFQGIGVTSRAVAVFATCGIRTVARKMHARGRLMAYIDKLDNRAVDAWNRAGLRMSALRSIRTHVIGKRMPNDELLNSFASRISRALRYHADPAQIYKAVMANKSVSLPDQGGYQDYPGSQAEFNDMLLADILTATRIIRPRLLFKAFTLAYVKNSNYAGKGLESTYAYHLLSSIMPENETLARLGEEAVLAKKESGEINPALIANIGSILGEMPHIKALFESISADFSVRYGVAFLTGIFDYAKSAKKYELAAAIAYAKHESFYGLASALG